MRSIASIVEGRVKQRPFLEEALSRGVINNAALAEEIRPSIEREIGKKVKFSAVNMAIRRLSEKLSGKDIDRIKMGSSDITVKSDLVEITLFKSAQNKVKDVYPIIQEGDFLTITQGLQEITVITSKRHEKRIMSIFPKRSVKKILNRLDAVTLNVDVSAVETRGLIYYVTRALNWDNINIIEIVSTFTELTIIVREKNTSRTYDTLKTLINS